jgi:hypothetical protein
MAIQITNKSNTIDVFWTGNGDKASFDKDKLTIELEGDYIQFLDGDNKTVSEHRFLYSDVTIPSTSSASELYDSLIGFMNVTEGGSTSSAIETVAVTEVSTQALSDGAAAVGASFVNLSNADAYILLGSGTASATNYTVKLKHGGDDIYETPYNYSGSVQVVFAHSGSGNLVITKFN